MKPAAQYTLIGVGTLALFCGAYIAFAKMKGAPMHELPVFGALFPAPAEPEGESSSPDEHATSSEPTDETMDAGAHAVEPIADAHGAANTDESTPEHAPPKTRNRASLLDAFDIASPYDSAELQDLVDRLKASHHEAEQRLASIEAREKALVSREEALAEREAELLELKGRLEAYSQTLKSAHEATARTEKSKEDQEEQSWSARSRLFADGDASTCATRLAEYPPADAARILRLLQPDRATELLDALPQERWREFAEAYSQTGSAPQSQKP